MEFTINVDAVLAWLTAFGYTALKVVSSIWITRKEFLYPIWNREGEQITRGLPHKVRALIRNFAVNPEWALLKLVAFVPVALFTGTKYWNKFSPWHIQSCPPRCKQCGDKGKYYTPSFVKGCKGNWTKCKCQSEHKDYSHSCMVCLDSGKIGPNRSCPHCLGKVAHNTHHEGNSYNCTGCGIYMPQGHACGSRCDCCRGLPVARYGDGY